MITFRNELPMDHELSFDHLIKLWSKQEAVTIAEADWMEWRLEEWMKEFDKTKDIAEYYIEKLAGDEKERHV